MYGPRAQRTGERPARFGDQVTDEPLSDLRRHQPNRVLRRLNDTLATENVPRGICESLGPHTQRKDRPRTIRIQLGPLTDTLQRLRKGQTTDVHAEQAPTELNRPVKARPQQLSTQHLADIDAIGRRQAHSRRPGELITQGQAIGDDLRGHARILPAHHHQGLPSVIQLLLRQRLNGRPSTTCPDLRTRIGTRRGI
jgi:hypothetical protein